MRDTFIVAKYTIKEMLRRKSFIITTIIILLMIVLGFNIPNIIESFNSSEEDEGLNTTLVQDYDNVFGSAFNEDIKFPSNVVQKTDLSIDELKKKVNDEEIEDALIINFDEESKTVKYEYIVKDATYISGLPSELEETLKELYQYNKISSFGLEDEKIESLYPNYETTVTAVEEEPKGNIFLMMLLSIVLFYAIYFNAFQVSSSITTEKTSKIIETIATSTSPTNIVIGKTLGTGFVGLVQLMLIVGTAYISAFSFMDKNLLNSMLDTSTLTIGFACILFAYFILGYLFYSFIYALTGSTVSKPEDVQTANQPVAIITVIGFYFAYFTLINPTSTLNSIAAIVPLSSPFCMPLRVMMGLSSTGEIITSLVVLALTSVLIAYISIRIYTNAILNYGSRLTIKDLVKMFKQR